ncbi:MAG: hypothetical protein AB7O56_14570 [Bauldia sp.]
MTEADRQTIAEGGREGPFFDERVFHALFGLDRSDLAATARSWPNVDKADPDVDLAVGGALLNLAGYPLVSEQDLAGYLTIPRSQLWEVLDRWNRSRGRI